VPEISLLRIISISAALFAFFSSTRSFSKPRVKGYVYLCFGIVVLGVDTVLETILRSVWAPYVPGGLQTAVADYAKFGLLAFGLIFMIIGSVRLFRSVKPHVGADYSDLVENSLVGVFLIQNGLFKYVNPKLAELSGYSRDELMEMPVMELITHDSRKRVANDLRRPLVDDDIFEGHYELTARRKDGTEIHVEVYGSQISLNGKPGIQGTLIDISERKQVEKAYKASEERFQALTNSSYDIIAETTMSGHFIYVSKNVSDILGYSPDDLQGKNIFAFIHPDDYMMVYNEFDKARQNRLSGRIEFRCRHKSGEWRWLESTGQEFKTGSGEEHGMLVSRDITMRKKMEEEIAKATKLESVGVLAGGIAHDFNNLLTVILGNVSLAKSSSKLDFETKNILKEAENACIRAKDVTQQFLTFSKGGEPVKKLASLADLLRESIEFTLHGAKARSEFYIPDDLWPVDMDSGQIGQVFHNLVLNAEQAMPAGGTIEITAENIQLGRMADLPLEEGSYVRVTIEDHGIGIAEENLAKIFDPYFTTRHLGSGLGLTTAYSIIKNHDGLINVESKPGHGTKFYIYLPAPITQEVRLVQPPPKERPTRLRVQNARVLVMDDDDTIRTSVGRMLKHLGYDVVVSEDGRQAIALYKDALRSGLRFDVVLMDLTIPGGMGGKETIVRLLEIDSETKAIVSSGYSNDPIMAEYRNYGFSGVIAKPYRLDHLNKVLQDVITGKGIETENENGNRTEQKVVKRLFSNN